jgi:polyisoprenyl-phosphate glycosyltransferase
MKLISIVIPVFCEEQNIHTLYERLETVTKEMSNYACEYIFVNDGSRDGSYVVMKKLASSDDRVKVVDFSRNFGKEIALSAGVEAASGAAVITIDADLQHPPELIPDMVKKWEEGADIVAAKRKRNAEQSLPKKIGSTIFYWVMKRISHVEIVSKATDFRLLDVKVVDVFKDMTERGRVFRGLIDWMGFDKELIEFNADSRSGGKPGYTYRKLLRLAIDSVTSFSLLPLKVAGFLGVIITILGGSLLTIMLPIRFLLGSSFFSSLAVVVVANTFLIGIVLSCLGLIALYIGNIHTEVANRPLYIVKNRINF